eukprot:gene4152-4474_t
MAFRSIPHLMTFVCGILILHTRHLVGFFHEQGVPVIAFVRSRQKYESLGLPSDVDVREGDLLKPASIACQGARAVIHAAGAINYFPSPKQQDDLYAVNVNGTVNLVDACMEQA